MVTEAELSFPLQWGQEHNRQLMLYAVLRVQGIQLQVAALCEKTRQAHCFSLGTAYSTSCRLMEIAPLAEGVKETTKESTAVIRFVT